MTIKMCSSSIKQVLLFGCLFFISFTNVFAGGSLVQLDANEIAKVKQSIKDGTASAHTQKAYGHLIKNTNALMGLPDLSVVHKTIDPPSGDKHDYMSVGRYWFPDPNTEDGLPWIRKDGETNPDTQTGALDRQRLGMMTKRVYTLALAYYFTENESYAEKGVSMLRTWFLDEKTAMNPHLKYAQSIPGNPKSRRSGILDGRLFSVSILDAIVLLSTSNEWNDKLESGMNVWFGSYMKWLTTSEVGKMAALQKNNHGSWYFFQVVAISWYLGDESLTKQTIELAKNNLINQLNSVGGQIHELERTKSFFYSCFNLDALTRIALISDKLGIDLWNYESNQGKGLKLAIDYLVNAVNQDEWEYATPGMDASYLAPVLGRVSNKVESKEYSDVLSNILADLLSLEKPESHQVNIYHDFALLHSHWF